MKRLNLAVTDKVKQQIDDIQKRISASTTTEVVRRAVGLLDYVTRTCDGQIVKVIVKRQGTDIELFF